MLRFLLFTVVVWMSAGSVAAQEWATVRVGDTAYFMGGKKPFSSAASCQLNADNGLLRILYVDSALAFGADSAFFFPRGLRGALLGGCVDTAAALWSGYRVVRSSGGVDLYFNSVGDTTTVKTRAHVGDSWTLALDTSGRTFRATVVGAGVDTVAGVPDSTKTVSIQAYAGGAPVGHPYNSRVLRWSKRHGWIMPLDFFLFPNLPPVSNEIGSPLDSSQMVRLDWPRIAPGLKRADLVKKYAPGNEWIWEQKYGGLIYGDVSRITTTYDSVIAFQSIDAARGLATLRTTVVVWQRHAPTGPPYLPYTTTTLNISVHTDTVLAAFPFDTFDYPSLPEVKTAGLPMSNVWAIKQELIGPKYRVAPACGGYTFSQSRGVGMIVSTGGCWKHMYHPDDWPVCKTVLAGFGLTHTVYPTSMQGFSQQGELRYLKWANCTSGSKFNVEALGISEDSDQTSGQRASLVPNPAVSSTQLRHLPAGPHTIILRDATGRTLQMHQATGPTADLPTMHLPTGVYFVEISGASGRTALKLQVLH